MKSLLIACILCTPVFANEWRVDATGGVAYRHQIIDLPQDQGKWYVTLMGTGPQTKQMANWFDSNPDLRKLKQQSHFHVLDSNSVMFKSRYAASVGDLPCVRIQQPDGKVIFQASANRLPLSAEALANSISTTCLRRRNVEPESQPYNLHLHYSVEPDQKPKPAPDQPQPDVFVKDQSMFEIPVWAFVIVGVVAVVAGIASEWAKELKNRG